MIERHDHGVFVGVEGARVGGGGDFQVGRHARPTPPSRALSELVGVHFAEDEPSAARALEDTKAVGVEATAIEDAADRVGGHVEDVEDRVGAKESGHDRAPVSAIGIVGGGPDHGEGAAVNAHDLRVCVVRWFGGCARRDWLYGEAMKKDTRRDTKVDELELFQRAMETLGAKPQPSTDGPSRSKGRGPAMPLVPDDGLDFDAIMRASRGPALLEGPPRKGSKSETDVARESPGATSSQGGEAGPERVSDTANWRSDVRAYEPSEEERALFLEAMEREVVAADREASAPVRAVAPRVEPLSSRIKRRVEIEAQLDLHGRTRAEAEPRVRAFLEECVAERWEVVAVVCGRGVHSDGGKPVLKPLVQRWLREDLREYVAEVAEAPAGMGGGGTLIVRVRLDVSA